MTVQIFIIMRKTYPTDRNTAARDKITNTYKKVEGIYNYVSK